jgi:putative spermidine/putrescine transport system permease protein
VVVIPLSKAGIALGSIFVVRLMSGGQSASVVFAMSHEIALLQYPPAAASAVVLMLMVILMVAAILRIVDVRQELSG